MTFDFSALVPSQAQNSVRYTSTHLNLYQRLIQYFTVVADYGGEYLDLINFNRDLFPQVLDLPTTEAIFQPEHGYSCPDGSIELAPLVRSYERVRALRTLGIGAAPKNIQVNFDTLAVGIGAGTTGVMNCLLPAIRDLNRHSRTRKENAVALTLPLYSVYDSLVQAHGLRPIYLQTDQRNRFLPSPDEVASILRRRPIAFIITFPTNPAQTTYRPDHWSQLARIIELCQETGTFLIADNIYEDTLWHDNFPNPEIFALASRPDYLIKVCGPSKDRPGFSGYRIGYYSGDPIVREGFFYYSSIQYNTPNSASRCLLCLDILFRFLRVTKESLSLHHLDLVGDHIAGWARPIDRQNLFDKISSLGLFKRYLTKVEIVEKHQQDSLSLLVEQAKSHVAFCDVVNEKIGNLLFIKVNEHAFPGTCHDLFLFLMRKVKIGILPGNAFGLPLQGGDAWFRITTIHDTPAHIGWKLATIAECILQYS